MAIQRSSPSAVASTPPGAPLPTGPEALAERPHGEALLAVRDLVVDFVTPDGVSRGLDGVSLDVGPGEVVGLVGETGCGKTLTGLSILGLLPPAARVTRGSIAFGGQDLLALRPADLRHLRGPGIGMVFQNPAAAFNPVFTIGTQLRLALGSHERLPRQVADERIRAVLADVGLADADRLIGAYPHQLSGGMLQRAMIANALVCNPRLLIADEPTTALDVTIEAQILRLIRRLQAERGFSVLFITHDLSVVRAISDRIVVLYAGRVAESLPTGVTPEHPYARGLVAAAPQVTSRRDARLASIPGSVPPDVGSVVGCAFADRCSWAVERCRSERPLLREIKPAHLAACHLAPLEDRS